MKTTTKPQESTSEIKRLRTQRKNSIITVLLLTVALVMPSTPNDEGLGAGDYAWAGLFFLGIMALAYTIVTNYRQSDELQQLLQLKAAALAFLVVMVGLFTAGLVHGLTEIALAPIMQVVTIAGVGLWSSLLALLNKRAADDK